jgi:hypothetical protein
MSTDEGNQEWTSGVYILHHVHINLAEKAIYSPVIPRVWGANIELMVAGIQPLLFLANWKRRSAGAGVCWWWAVIKEQA